MQTSTTILIVFFSSFPPLKERKWISDATRGEDLWFLAQPRNSAAIQTAAKR